MLQFVLLAPALMMRPGMPLPSLRAAAPAMVAATPLAAPQVAGSFGTPEELGVAGFS